MQGGLLPRELVQGGRYPKRQAQRGLVQGAWALSLELLALATWQEGQALPPEQRFGVKGGSAQGT